MDIQIVAAICTLEPRCEFTLLKTWCQRFLLLTKDALNPLASEILPLFYRLLFYSRRKRALAGSVSV